MKAIVRPRQMGKTSELIKLAANTDSTILCVRHSHIRSVVDLAKKIGYAIPEPMSVDSFQKPKHIDRPRRILIDNAEWVLIDLLRLQDVRLVGLAMTGVNDVDYNEQYDCEQWQEFKRTNKDLTFIEFCNFKYGLEIE